MHSKLVVVVLSAGFLAACSGEPGAPELPTASAPEFQSVDPTTFIGRAGFPVFNLRTNSQVVNFCGLQQDKLFCGGVGPDNANQVDVSADTVRFYVGEGPLEPGLKYLEPGQKVTYGQSECAVHADKTVECSVGEQKISIDPSTREISVK